MEFNEYQIKTKETAIYLDKIKEEFPNLPEKLHKLLAILYVGNGLGEVGEIQNKIKKILRDSAGNITEDVKKSISKEIGDAIWYLAQLANELDLSLNDIAIANLDKLNLRKEKNTLTGSGDNR